MPTQNGITVCNRENNTLARCIPIVFLVITISTSYNQNFFLMLAITTRLIKDSFLAEKPENEKRDINVLVGLLKLSGTLN